MRNSALSADLGLEARESAAERIGHGGAISLWTPQHPRYQRAEAETSLRRFETRTAEDVANAQRADTRRTYWLKWNLAGDGLESTVDHCPTRWPTSGTDDARCSRRTRRVTSAMVGIRGGVN